MRNPFCALIAFVALFIVSSGSPVHAQEDNISLDSADITLEPKKLLGQATGEAKPAVKEYGDEWWAINVKFETKEEITEEIKVKVYFAGYDALKEDAFVVLTGEVTFINVLEGKEHQATFYLHPGAAERFSGVDKRGKEIGESAGQHNVHVEIFEKGRVVTEMDMKDDDLNWFREGAPVPDVLLGVKDSPWWPYESLAYSQIKEGR
ncbi:MAG: hypothetical protein AAF571_09245 [Verrucomicrobiota bacterium]